MSVLDKAAKTLGRSHYHLHLKPGHVARFVLLPVDPDRALRIANYPEDVRAGAFHREFLPATGRFRHRRLRRDARTWGPIMGIGIEF